ncbi:MAG TPA: Rrf2 family transcriptional regulator [Anaerohalosphaeraceae bacterium]|nr:Rrf2 family transcriptional regulator [Anaerohalosphaeraceae bacterium]
MMPLPKKCVYALRALFELALRAQKEPVNARQIADSQSVPLRFLETILNELKQGGFVVTVRGKQGGFLLARPASQMTAGEVIDFLRKTDSSLLNSDRAGMSPVPGDYAFEHLWGRLSEAVNEVLFKTTFQDMVDQEIKCQSMYVDNYVI